MSSEQQPTNGDRQVAIVDQQTLSQLFPGVPPNTQVRIVGPLPLPERATQPDPPQARPERNRVGMMPFPPVPSPGELMEAMAMDEDGWAHSEDLIRSWRGRVPRRHPVRTWRTPAGVGRQVPSSLQIREEIGDSLWFDESGVDMGGTYTSADQFIPREIRLRQIPSDEVRHQEREPMVRIIPREETKAVQSDATRVAAPSQTLELTKPPTRDLTEEEYVTRIVRFVELALGPDVDNWISACGPNMEIGSHPRQVKLNNLVFEVNGLIVTCIHVGQLPVIPNADLTWLIHLTYVLETGHYHRGPFQSIGQSDKDLATAVRKSYASLKALKRCQRCEAIWNTTLSDVCVICLFCDYFTRENDEHECPVCTDSIRDWTTLDCGHRLCYKCMFKLQPPRRCPLCRHGINL